jgi:hypothetical protein
MAVIVAPAGDCSIAMTRDCFDLGWAFLALESTVACCGGFAAAPAAGVDAAERFFTDVDIEFTDVDIEILLSVEAASRRTTEAPPRPSGQRGGIPERPQRPKFRTLPLQSQSKASPFWIMLLLSVGGLEHGTIKQILAAPQSTRLRIWGVGGSNPSGRARTWPKYRPFQKPPG